MQRIAELGRDRMCSAFYDVVIHFCYEEGKSVEENNREKNEWSNINRENRLASEKIWEMHDRRHEELYVHMRKVCVARYRMKQELA
jgi:hypothetical protein